METNTITRKARRRNDYQKERSRSGVEARRRIREQRAEAISSEIIGTVTFDGPYFCGTHTLRIAAVSDGRPVLDIIVDGMLSGARTARGIRRLIAAMITGETSP